MRRRKREIYCEGRSRCRHYCWMKTPSKEDAALGEEVATVAVGRRRCCYR